MGKIDSFVELVMKLRGNSPATVKDIVELRRLMQEETTKKNVHLSRMEERLRHAGVDRLKIDEKLDNMARMCRNMTIGVSSLQSKDFVARVERSPSETLSETLVCETIAASPATCEINK